MFDGLTRVCAWRANLADRPSVRDAVAPDYHDVLTAFLIRRGEALSHMIGGRAQALAVSF